MKQDILKFLQLLAANNNREWFAAHKDLYQQVKEQTDETASRLISLVSEYEPEAALLTPSDCTYRIYRDTRFSLDKSPYKTHIGIFVNPLSGKKGETMGHYLHIEPGASFYAAGTGWSSPNVLLAIRRGIYSEIGDYLAIVESPEFKKEFAELGTNCLKKAPKGFDPNWPYIDYLKPRCFGATRPLDDSFFQRKDWIDDLRGTICQGARLNRFLNYYVEEAIR